MPDDFAFDVFLSHSSHDKAIVRPLAERLRQDGLRVWFDEWELRPGGWMSLRSKARGSSSLSHIRRPTL